MTSWDVATVHTLYHTLAHVVSKVTRAIQKGFVASYMCAHKVGASPCRAISEVMGYTHCTAVQAESLGPLLSGADMVVKAKTGTGKTLAFLIPGIEQAGSPNLIVRELWVPM